MITVEKIDTRIKKQVERFIAIPYRLYNKQPQWVPLLKIDARMYLNKNKHPFYEHSDGDFFIATQGGRDIGRVAVLENRHFNDYHNKKVAQFYFFDCEENLDIAVELFNRVFEWAKQRDLNQIVGPKGLGPLDGYGILIEGFEHRQMMTMMNYNYPYYPSFLEKIGFEKEVDFVSCYIDIKSFKLPERIHHIAERIQQRGTLNVHQFTSKAELKKWAAKIGEAYNNAFVNNWEYYPLTDNEIKFVLDNILIVADPRLIKVIAHQDDVVGFLFGFPDVSAALQRSKGNLLPFGIFDLLLEMRRTKWIALNGAGILPQFHGHGGNALLYSEMEKTLNVYNFLHADLTQVAETAVQMRHDLENIGGKAYKNHRVYSKYI
jgi:hypothetical protein